MANSHETEWESELELELEGLGEFEHPEMAHEFEHGEAGHEFEHPELAHEFEQHEWEHPEMAHEFEQHEWEHPEMAHEFEQHEWEHPELAHEFEQHEYEHGEQFFGRIARGIGGFIKRAAPILKSIAKVAAPMVGTAIGGPFGAILGKVASSALGESGQHEWEQHELAHEFEQHEAAHEVAHEIAHHELTHHEALAEMMAEAAAHEQHEGEAEAMVGAAVMTALSPQDRRALRRVLKDVVRGVAVLTRILRRRRITRPAVRAVPTIVRRAVRDLKQQAAAGQPITRRAAARATVTQMQRVLGNPSACAAAIRQNVRASRALQRRGTAG
jgi:hypothetical protein